MAATDVGILFLDAQLRINRFTPRVSELFNIVEGDEGRSITNFTHRLEYDDLAEDARMVSRTVSIARSRFRSPGLGLRRSRMANSTLRDRRILVVEDEYLIAMNLQDGLENAGSVVLGPVPSVEKAIKKIESEPHIDAAVLDVNLGGALAYPVADLLVARKIPFVFTSGYEDNVLRSRYSGVKNCPKPYLFQAIEEALVEAMSRS
jgi:CheY-like chemotaxis protein